MDPASREAFTFLVVVLHESGESAGSLVEDVTTVAPRFADAAERWSGVLAPFRWDGLVGGRPPPRPVTAV